MSGKSASGMLRHEKKQILQFSLRMPPEIRDQLEAEAIKSQRTMTAEILRRLEASLAREEFFNGLTAPSLKLDEDMIRLASGSLTRAIHQIADRLIQEQQRSQS